MMRDIERGITLAITIIGCIVTGTYLGYWLDQLLGTMPLLLSVGIIVGTVLAFSYLYYFGKGKVKK